MLKLDESYTTALVGTPDHKHLWLLHREPTLDQATVDAYRAEATTQGFNLDEWIVTPQDGGQVTDQELAAQEG